MKRNTLFVLVLLTLFCAQPWCMRAATLTIDGSSTNGYIPIYPAHCDQTGTKSQSVYLTSDIESMAGSNITGIRYYADGEITWKTLWMGGTVPTFQVSLAEVDASSLTGLLTPHFSVVYTGQPAKGTKELYFDFSACPYYYSGTKNLLVQVSVVVAGDYQIMLNFYAVSRTGASYCYYEGSEVGSDYLPKTTFTYEEASATCHKPTNLSYSDLTTSSVTLSWEQGGDESQWQYICLPAVTTMSWKNPGVQTATSATANVTGLSPNTAYNFYVRAYCDEDNQSGGAMYHFTTQSLAERLPFSENFNCLSTGVPAGWDNTEGTTTDDEYKWCSYSKDASKLRDGACLRFDSYYNGNGNTNNLYMPAVKVRTATTLSFYYKNPAGGDLSVYYSTGGVETALATGLTDQSDWKKATYSIPAQAEEQEVVVIFKATSNYGYGDAYIYLDDVSLFSAAAPAPPTGLSASGNTGNSVQLSWSSSASLWGVRYRTSCGVWSVVDDVTANPYTLSGLEPDTEYEIQVKAVSAAGGQSAWSAPITVLLTCGVVHTLPWSHNFEGDATGSGVLPNCWSSISYTYERWLLSDIIYPYVAESGGHGADKCLEFSGGVSGESEQYIILPEINELLSELTLEFYYKNGSSSANRPQFTVGYLTDAEDASTFVAKQALSKQTSYSGASVDLCNFPADVHTIAIKYGGGSRSESGYIDDMFIRRTAHVFTNASGDGYWNTAANWDKGVVPTIDAKVVIRQPIAVAADETAMAKSVVIDHSEGNTGRLEIDPAGLLVIADTLRRVTGSVRAKTYAPTTEDDLIIGSSRYGNGGLAIGAHNTEDGLNNATVNFYTKSHGESGSSASIAQYVGTPFSNRPQMLYQFYNSWMYKIEYKGGDALSWTRLSGSDRLEAFEGYCVFSADPLGHVYWMQGTLVASEDQTISLAYRGGESTDAINENLLANSWAAPIRINAFEETDFVNADATIYIYNSGSPDDYAENSDKAIDDLPGQYSVFTPGSATDADNIPSMQSFSVYANNDNPSLSPQISLNYERLVYEPASDGLAITPTRTPARWHESGYGEPERLRLYVTGESGYGDRLYMLEREDYSEGYENGFDGRKIFGEAVAPQLYAVTSEGNMAINCLPTWEGAVLGFRKGTEDATYTFTFDYSGDDQWYLNDLKEQLSTRIAPDNSYLFYAGEGDQAARFVISRTPLHGTPTAIDNVVKGGAEVRKLLIDGALYIIRDGRMYDATGAAVR